jgi:arylsulfatase A-like enzyme
MRADSLSCYGYPRPTSPFLDELAAQGVRFDRAYATSSWTVPSIASMLTSTYVNQHGLGKRFPGRGRSRSWAVIPGDVPNLAQLMSDGGYRTFGLVANLNLPADRGFDRGFDRYSCIGSVNASSVRRALQSWLPDIAGAEEPWFFWLLLFDPHGPYNGRQPWLDEFDPQWQRAKRMNGMPPTKFSLSAKELSQDEVAVAKACYDSEIRAADELIREVFALLPGADDAFVLVNADHGEEFLEHGRTLHGNSLFDQQLRIPFIVRPHDGRSAGIVVKEPVSIVDVLPTILGAAGIDVPPEAAGLDLMGPDGVHVPRDRVIFAELRAQRAVIDARWKLIATMGRTGQDLLFDQQSDPGELSNLAASAARELEARRGHLARYEAQTRQAPPDEIPLDEKTLEKLKGLGYIGGGG